jgi:hypothetical protein
LFVSWYTQLDGQPVWLTGTGPLNKDVAYIDLISTQGGNFPPAFNAADVQRTDWGLLRLDFTDENHANISWETQAEGYNNGEMAIQRLTQLSQTSTNTSAIDACLSGTFFNQDQSGHGIILEVLEEPENTLVLTWFVYNETQQFWLLASGSIQGDSATMQAKYTTGTTFPPLFVSADVQRVDWGEISVDKINNDTIRLSWFPNDENQSFGNGNIEMQRLTHIEGINCQQ